MRQRFFYLLVLAAVLASCSGDKVKYRIGISQCSDDIWRDKQNAELRLGAYFQDGVELKFAVNSAHSTVKRVKTTRKRGGEGRWLICHMLFYANFSIIIALSLIK